MDRSTVTKRLIGVSFILHFGHAVSFPLCIFFMPMCLTERCHWLIFFFLKVAHQRRVSDFLFGFDRLGQLTSLHQALLAKRPYFVFWVSVHKYVGSVSPACLGGLFWKGAN
jgi:hypothetical protein